MRETEIRMTSTSYSCIGRLKKEFHFLGNDVTKLKPTIKYLIIIIYFFKKKGLCVDHAGEEMESLLIIHLLFVLYVCKENGN